MWEWGGAGVLVLWGGFTGFQRKKLVPKPLTKLWQRDLFIGSQSLTSGPSPKPQHRPRNLIPISQASPSQSHTSLAQQAEDAGLHPPGHLRRPPLPHSCGGLPPSPPDAARLPLPAPSCIPRPPPPFPNRTPPPSYSEACTRHDSTLL
ncbi:hypothetical protein SEVIR_1G250751v4 [Setaria viridis]